MDVIFNRGITQNQVDELINYSNNDNEVKKNTNDAKRFADRKSYNNWLKIPREIYTLTNLKDELLGIVWFRTQELKENYGITFAIRLYGEARGKGLSEDFLKQAFKEFKNSPLYKKNSSKKFWLETRRDNIPAIKLYEKFNFKKTNMELNGRIVMIQS